MLTCIFCERGSARSATRSHSNIKTLTRQRVNLQVRRIEGKKALVCTRCLRTQTRQAAK